MNDFFIYEWIFHKCNKNFIEILGMSKVITRFMYDWIIFLKVFAIFFLNLNYWIEWEYWFYVLLNFWIIDFRCLLQDYVSIFLELSSVPTCYIATQIPICSETHTERYKGSITKLYYWSILFSHSGSLSINKLKLH